MENLPNYVSLLFIAVTIITVAAFFFATRKNLIATGLLLVIGGAQALLSSKGFYLETEGMPPRFPLLILPAILLMLFAFLTPMGRRFMDQIDWEAYTWLHTIRIVVEIVLLFLFLNQLLPESMTFEGRNYDILSGISAPFIAYFGIRRKKMGTRGLLIWNIICLGLVLQVVVTGILSAPSPIQQLSFDQPNFAILNFPFVWLPSIVVPVVIFGHIAAIRHYRRILRGR